MPNSIEDLVVALTYPPTLSLWLGLAALVLIVVRRRKLGAALLALGVAWSAVWSVPIASDALRGLLERRYPTVADAASLPTADAIVVLGGGHYGWLDRPEVDAQALKYSRVAAGARAWWARRAPLVILSGGGGGGKGSEARRMADAMERLGVPASVLLLEENSRDTRDNAEYTAEIARRHGLRRLLLVTSSLHMPRANLLFREAGIEVVPVPVPEGAPLCGWKQRWVPSRGALWRSGRAWKELAGLLAARL